MEALFVVIFIAVFVGIIVLAIFFNGRAVFKRKLKKYPLMKPSDIVNEEMVRINGEVQFFKDKLTGPLSGRECAYYKVEVEEHRGSGKRSRWVTIIEEEKKSNFIIKSGQDFVLVNTDVARAILVEDDAHTSGMFNDASEHLKAYLGQHGQDSEGLFGFNRQLRYNEGIIEVGENVTVAGFCKWEKMDDPALSNKMNKILVLYGNIEEPLMLSDDPKFLNV